MDWDYPAGWRNYPTWAVYMWLADESRIEAAAHAARQRTMRRFRELAEGLVAEGLVSKPSLASDLLGWALEQVDWEFVKDEILRIKRGDSPHD